MMEFIPNDKIVQEVMQRKLKEISDETGLQEGMVIAFKDNGSFTVAMRVSKGGYEHVVHGLSEVLNQMNLSSSMDTFIKSTNLEVTKTGEISRF